MKLDTITEFFDAQAVYAIVGVSRDKKKFGNQVYTMMQNKGFRVLAVNPFTSSINNDVCYKSIAELPAEVTRVILITRSSKTDTLLYEAAMKGISRVWVQNACETNETESIAKHLGISVICKQCIFMFTEPVTGIHKFHKNILRFFGKLPK